LLPRWRDAGRPSAGWRRQGEGRRLRHQDVRRPPGCESLCLFCAALRCKSSRAAPEAEARRDEAAGRGDAPEDKTINYAFRLGIKYRDRSGNFDQGGYCNDAIAEDAGHDVRFKCGVDSEGGGITVALSKDNKSTLRVIGRIVVTDRSKPDDAGEVLSAGADDKVFRVDRTDMSECAELVTDREEFAALSHK